ncbi:hypothetical protein [Flavobacterium phycosphaerae]|uniref:hypothetical protein n=1 Tax=Flavobacterium phycosphaerae TaxID=2697515 RepID=UPI0013898361|nr:hypothetical protein [Flavobacterium phycosphaerae]
MIKVGFLVSYDYELLPTALKQVYDYADKIYLSVDVEKKTWSGNPIVIPDSFYAELAALDVAQKIEFHSEVFYIPELTPIQCETRQRNLLAKRMGKGWIIQLDSDEYVLHFKELAAYLKRHSYLLWFSFLFPVTLQGNMITLFRETASGYLIINKKDKFNFITNHPKYSAARNNYKITKLPLTIDVVHQSWARSESEIVTKINNWGHRDDFDTAKFLAFWKNINEENYKEFVDFHPLDRISWDFLLFKKAANIDELLTSLEQNAPKSFGKIAITQIAIENLIVQIKIGVNIVKRIIRKLK